MDSFDFMLVLITNTVLSVLSELFKKNFHVHHSHKEVKQDLIKLISKQKNKKKTNQQQQQNSLLIKTFWHND